MIPKVPDAWKAVCVKEHLNPEDWERVRPRGSGPTICEEYGISMSDVLTLPSDARKVSDGYLIEHPLHGATGGGNLFVNKTLDLWCCYRHGTGGDPLTWIAVREGFVSCEDAGPLDVETALRCKAVLRRDGMIQEHEHDGADEKPAEKGDPGRYFDKSTFVPKRLADAILDTHHFITFTDTNEVHVYDSASGLYTPRGEACIQNLTQVALQDRSRNAYITEVEGHIRRNRFFDREDLNADPDLIPLGNGIIDRRERQDDGRYRLIDYSPHVPYISKIATDYDPDAPYDEWVEYLESTNPGNVDLLQEAFGDLLYRDYWLKYAFMHNGEGDNGKTVILNVMDSLLGIKNVSHQSLEDLEKNRFATANLFGMFANIRGDIGSKALRDTSTFKMLTGEDAIVGEKKFCNPFTFHSYAKQHYSCNELPPTRDVSRAFYDRWFLLDYPYVFVNDPEPNTNQRKKDPKFKKKFLTPRMLSGILNWALIGLDRVMKTGRFTETDASRDIKARWIAKTNTLAWFVGVKVKVDVGAYVDKDVFYDAYTEFCRDNNVGVQFDVDQVTKKLPTLTTTSIFRPSSDKEKRPRAWKNISVDGIPRKGQKAAEKQANLKVGTQEGTQSCPECPDNISITRAREKEVYDVHDASVQSINNMVCFGTFGTLELVKSSLSLRAARGLTVPSYETLLSKVTRDLTLDDRSISSEDVTAAFNALVDTDDGRDLITKCVGHA